MRAIDTRSWIMLRWRILVELYQPILINKLAWLFPTPYFERKLHHYYILEAVAYSGDNSRSVTNELILLSKLATINLDTIRSTIGYRGPVDKLEISYVRLGATENNLYFGTVRLDREEYTIVQASSVKRATDPEYKPIKFGKIPL